MYGVRRYILSHNVWLKNFDEFLINTNREFYFYLVHNGLNIDLKSKDQQKIYLHFLIKEICEFLKDQKHGIIFYHNNWGDECGFQMKIIKKIYRIFGFKILIHWLSFEDFCKALDTGEAKITTSFETMLNVEIKPKSFRSIKKFLEKEGYTDLIENYFSDITNKMVILG